MNVEPKFGPEVFLKVLSSASLLQFLKGQLSLKKKADLGGRGDLYLKLPQIFTPLSSEIFIPPRT